MRKNALIAIALIVGYHVIKDQIRTARLNNKKKMYEVKKALEAKKNVLCEKPIAMNAEETREMFKTAKENNVLLMELCAYVYKRSTVRHSRYRRHPVLRSFL